MPAKAADAALIEPVAPPPPDLGSDKQLVQLEVKLASVRSSMERDREAVRELLDEWPMTPEAFARPLLRKGTLGPAPALAYFEKLRPRIESLQRQISSRSSGPMLSTPVATLQSLTDSRASCLRGLVSYDHPGYTVASRQSWDATTDYTSVCTLLAELKDIIVALKGDSTRLQSALKVFAADGPAATPKPPDPGLSATDATDGKGGRPEKSPPAAAAPSSPLVTSEQPATGEYRTGWPMERIERHVAALRASIGRNKADLSTMLGGWPAMAAFAGVAPEALGYLLRLFSAVDSAQAAYRDSPSGNLANLLSERWINHYRADPRNRDTEAAASAAMAEKTAADTAVRTGNVLLTHLRNFAGTLTGDLSDFRSRLSAFVTPRAVPGPVLPPRVVTTTPADATPQAKVPGAAALAAAPQEAAPSAAKPVGDNADRDPPSNATGGRGGSGQDSSPANLPPQPVPMSPPSMPALPAVPTEHELDVSGVWLMALGAASMREGRTGLRRLAASKGRPKAERALSIMLRCPDAGLALAAALRGKHGPLPLGISNDESLSRGEELLSAGRWLDAYDLFAALPPPLAALPAARVALGLCVHQLGRPAADVAATLGDAALAAGATCDLDTVACRAAVEALVAERQAQAQAGAIKLAGPACGKALRCLLQADRGPGSELLRVCALLATGVLSRHLRCVAAPGLAPAPPAAPQDAASAAAAAREQRWQRKAAGIAPLQALLQLTGLHPLKERFMAVADVVGFDRRLKRDPLQGKQFSALFTGSPGSGKSTCARLYAELLQELNLVPRGALAEASGAMLAAGGASGGAAGLKARLDQLPMEGGIFLLDDAQQLRPRTNRQGAEVLDVLLAEMGEPPGPAAASRSVAASPAPSGRAPKRKGPLIVLLVSYRREYEEELMVSAPGLASRMASEFVCGDLDEAGLRTLLQAMLAATQPPLQLDDGDKYVRIAAKRLARQANQPGFGNARAVRAVYEAAREAQATRVLAEEAAGLQPDFLRLSREDLLGPRLAAGIEASAAFRELDAMLGLEQVKRAAHRLASVRAANVEAEEAGLPSAEVALNRLFLGNPGTGKTTVARIYGEILRDLGMLSRGDVVVKTPADFIGSVLGESEARTRAILEATRGRVLVIDEAYGLYGGGGSVGVARNIYADAAVDALVGGISGAPGEDRAVLLLGYEGPMLQMLRDANPGLARRFRPDDAWVFEDYGDEALLRIMCARAAGLGLGLDLATARGAVRLLAQERMRPNFGNGGAVASLLARAAERMDARLLASGRSAAERAAAGRLLLPADFLREDSSAARTQAALSEDRGAHVPAPLQVEDLFADLVGNRSIVAKLRELQATITAARQCGLDPLSCIEMNFLFVGAPGVGKTTVARRVGRMFESLGLLGSADVVECSASDFVTGYSGQAAKETRKVFEKALGKVLLIDEAYRLNPRVGGPYMREALDEMVQILTDTRFRGKQVVIFAGYPQQIEELMEVNPGLRSRMSTTLVFEDLRPADAADLLRAALRSKSVRLSEAAEAALPGLLEGLIAAPGWSNGRTVHTWASKLFTAAAVRMAQAGGGQAGASLRGQLVVEPADLLGTVGTLIAREPGPASQTSQLRRLAVPADLSHDASDAVAAYADGMPPPVFTAAVATRTRLRELEAEPAEEAGDDEGDDVFGGLSSAFLRALQDALLARGRDAVSAAGVAALAQARLGQDAGLIADVARRTGLATDAARDGVSKWQDAVEDAFLSAEKTKNTGQRPIWRCAVCGRQGCNFAPYIEGYEDVELE